MKKLKNKVTPRDFLILVSFLLFLNAGCKKDIEIIGNDCYTASNGFCGEMCLDKNYGNNFELSLSNLKEEKLSWYQIDTIIVESQKLQNIKDSKGISVEEEFYMITFINPIVGFKIHEVNDVLDENGNHYFINWCED